MKPGCLIGIASLIAVPIAGLFLLFSVPAWINDQKLGDLEERFLSYPLPPETHFSDYGAEGSIALRGNGNHCDYRVRLSLYTTLPEDEIVAYYGAAAIRGVEAERAPVKVYFAKDVPGAPSNGTIRGFIAELIDSTDAGLDLRCH